MNKPLDRESIAKAMKEAAWVAKHGTREERSGRFIAPLPTGASTKLGNPPVRQKRGG